MFLASFLMIKAAYSSILANNIFHLVFFFSILDMYFMILIFFNDNLIVEHLENVGMSKEENLNYPDCMSLG